MSDGNQEEIQQLFNSLAKESENLVNNVISLVYFMRGAISYDDMMFRTPGERDLFSNFIEQRLESEKDKPNPTY